MTTPILDRTAIERLLPHREPFLMVDEVLELEAMKRAVGIKHVRDDEDWTRGHFPGNPILPGVLMAEALAQMAAITYLVGVDAPRDVGVYLVGFDKLRLRRMVRPGERVRLEVTMVRERRGLWFFDGVATVDGERAAEGSFLAKIAPLATHQ